jgi:tetratricopeptide (TPR) repeat protein
MAPLAVAALLIGALAGAGQSATGPAAPLPRIDLSALPREAAAAIGEAYRGATRNSTDPAAVGHLAIVLHAWEQWEDAGAAYRAAQRLAPKDYRWWHLAGLLETRRGRHQDALPLFERAATLAPEQVPVRLRLAEARLETGDVEGSAPVFRELARQADTAAAAEYGLGRVAIARGDLTAALEHFDRAVTIFPEFGAAHYARALAYRRLGRSAEALDALERQKRCLPCWPATGDALAESIAAVREDAAAVLQRGIALARENQDALAIEAHERALTLDPSLVPARVNLITLYGRVGDWTRAKAQYQDALRGGTHVPEAHVNYAQVLLAQKRPADAVPVFRSALALTPADPQAWNGLGMAFEQSGDTAAAADAYGEASRHAPAFRAARFNYARTLVAKGRLQDAIVELEKLRTPEDGETARYVFALAAALVRAGDVERGRAEAVRALELARRYGQQDLAATIQRDLAQLR